MAREYRHMVAIGSSFAAGPGIAPVVEPAAMRSGSNYAHLVARTLGAELVDASVSGATTATILSEAQKTPRKRFAPQIESVSADTDLVTVTAGGNDLGYLGSVLAQGLMNRFSKAPVIGSVVRGMQRRRDLVLPDDARLQGAADGLTRIVEQTRARAPRATVVLVDYLPLFDEADATSGALGFTPVQLRHFRSLARLLSDAYAQAAAATGAELIAASSYPVGHGVASADPWIAPLQPFRALGASMHPNAAGMRAVASEILAHLQELP
jgi:lysophospholipase L1-like esterase